MSEVLTVFQFKKYLKENKLSGLVLDIDETLSWGVYYWVKEMQVIFGNPERLTVEEMVAKYRYTQNIPYWQNSKTCRWMWQAIKSNEINENLPLIKNADLIVQKINKIIPIIGYLTIRPKSVMTGTKRWLSKFRFPEAPIIPRPNHVSFKRGNEWKAKSLVYLYQEVVGIVDDNPKLLNFLPHEYKGRIYLYNNTDNQRRDLKVYPCLTWETVWQRIAEQYEK